MKMKKIRALFFSLACVLLLLTSCSPRQGSENNSLSTAGTAQSGEEEEKCSDLVRDLPTSDFHETQFRIATDSAHLVFSSNSESVVGKAYYLRNAAVEKKYNVKLSLTDESGLPTIADRIKTEALAGTDYCDLVLLESNRFQSLASPEILTNARSVPYLNYRADGFFEKSLDETTLGSFTYGFCGDFTYEPEQTYAVFFNRSLLAQTALPDLYQLVRDEQWDMDNFLLYAEEVFSLCRANKLSVSGIVSPQSTEEMVNVFWAATGFSFFQNDYATRPALVYNNENTKNFITTLRNIFFRSTSYTSSSDTALTSFRNGESFFMIAPLSFAKEVKGFGVDWGIVPIPKLDINQTATYSYMGNNHVIAGFANGSSNLTMSGMVTTALFAASKNLNQTLKVQSYLNLYLNAPQDAEMMERIIANPYFDPAAFFGQSSPAFKASTQTLLYRAISSEGTFADLYKQYQRMLENDLNTKLG